MLSFGSNGPELQEQCSFVENMRKQCVAFILNIYNPVKRNKVRDMLGKKNITQSIIIFHWFVFKKKKWRSIWFSLQMTICFLNLRQADLRRCWPERTFAQRNQQHTPAVWPCSPRVRILGNDFPFLRSAKTVIFLFSQRLVSPRFKITMLYSSKKKLSSILKKKVY